MCPICKETYDINRKLCPICGIILTDKNIINRESDKKNKKEVKEAIILGIEKNIYTILIFLSIFANIIFYLFSLLDKFLLILGICFISGKLICIYKISKTKEKSTATVYFIIAVVIFLIELGFISSFF